MVWCMWKKGLKKQNHRYPKSYSSLWGGWHVATGTRTGATSCYWMPQLCHTLFLECNHILRKNNPSGAQTSVPNELVVWSVPQAPLSQCGALGRKELLHLHSCCHKPPAPQRAPIHCSTQFNLWGLSQARTARAVCKCWNFCPIPLFGLFVAWICFLPMTLSLKTSWNTQFCKQRISTGVLLKIVSVLIQVVQLTLWWQ